LSGHSAKQRECLFVAGFCPSLTSDVATRWRRDRPSNQAALTRTCRIFHLTRQSKMDISHSVTTAGRKAPLFLKNPFKFNGGLFTNPGSRQLAYAEHSAVFAVRSGHCHAGSKEVV
jgi:hypothetical protein